MNYWGKLQKITKTHLCQIPYIIIYPFAIVSQVLYKLCSILYNNICEKMNKEIYIKKRREKILKKAVNTALHGHSNILHTFQNKQAARVFTAMLQTISGITTYAGFVFFLGNVNPIAPLFMAVTVQGLCYYLLNYTSSKKHSGAWKRNLVLLLLMLVSTLTSYIGVFNGMAKPGEQLRDQYESYAKTVNSLIESEITANYSYDIQRKDIDEIYRQLNEAIENADKIIARIEKENASIITTQTIPISWTDENGMIRYGTKTVTVAEASNTIAANNTQIEKIRGYKNSISEYLSQNLSIDDVLKAINAILNDPEKLNSSADGDKDIYNQFVSAEKTLNNLNEVYTNESGSSTIDMEKAISASKKRAQLKELGLKDYEEIVSDHKDKLLNFNLNNAGGIWKIFGFIENLNTFVVSKELIEAENIRDILKKVSETNYMDLYPLLNAENQNKLSELKSYTVYPNTQIIPFTAPFNPEKRLMGTAIFAFVVALLVDLLSFLISWSLVKKKQSILYFDKISEIKKNREEMIEDCLMYICLDDEKINNLNEPSEIQHYIVSTVNTTLSGFLEKMHYIYVPDALNAFAYLSHDEMCNFSKREKLLFQTLNNAALIHPFHKSELLFIITEEFDASLHSTKTIIEKYNYLFEDDEIYYLISKNFHFWFCENFSELLQNTQSIFKQSSENIYEQEEVYA